MSQFQTVPHANISRGMDTRSALKNIREGFAEEIRNMDTNSAGFVEKRKGFQSHIGNLPFRVTRINEDSAGGFEMEFDSSLSFSLLGSTPVLGKGKLWNTANGTRLLDITSGTVSGGLVGDALAEGTQIKVKYNGVWTTGFLQESLFLEELSAVTDTNLPYALLEDQEIYWESFTNNIYKTMTSGVNRPFSKSFAETDVLVGSAVQISPTQYEIVETDLTTINSAEVSHTIDTNGGSVLLANYYPDLDADFVKYSDTGLVPNGSDEIVITQATHNLPNKNIIYQVWQEDDPIAGTNTLAEINEFIIAPNGDITITVQDNGSESYTVALYDVPVVNTDITGISGTEEVFEFTVTNPAEFSFVQTYLLTSAGQERVRIDSTIIEGATVTVTVDLPDGAAESDLKVVVLEGSAGIPSISVGSDGVPDDTPEFCIYGMNIDAIVFREDAGVINALDEYSSVAQSDLVVGMGGNLFVESSNFILPKTRVDIRGFSSFSEGIQTVAPLLISTPIVSITNNGDNTATAQLDGTPDLSLIPDSYIKISEATNSIYNSVFKVTSVDDIGKTVTFAVVESGTFVSKSETDTCAVMVGESDRLEMETGHSFQVGDLITSNQFPTYNPIVREAGSDYLILGGVENTRDVYTGVTLTGTRTSNIIEIPAADTVQVFGDVLTIKGYERKFRVLAVDASGINTKLTLDESIEVTDSSTSTLVTTVEILSRWLCIEYPNLNDRTVKHFTSEYQFQKRLQTARINDSIFYTDYIGSVMKYDGQSVYRAGLISWQPRVTSWIDYTEERLSVTEYSGTLTTGSSEIVFTSTTMPPLPALQRLYIPQIISSESIGILDYNADEYKITIDRLPGTIPGSPAAFPIYIPQRRGYYFKLQAYDRNNNIVASATTDYRDSTVSLLKSGKVYHKISNLPKFAAYDYERVDLEIYATKSAEVVVPEFFKIRTFPLDFSEYEGKKEIVISDSLGNATFTNPDDLVSNAISLQTTGSALERPVSYDQPQLSKYIISIANRLVQGNVRGYNELELRIESDSLTPLSGQTVSVNSTVYEAKNPADSVPEITGIDHNFDDEELVLTLDSSLTVVEGQWVQFGGSDVTGYVATKNALFISGWWKVKSDSSGTTLTVEANLTKDYGTSIVPNQQLYVFKASNSTYVPVIAYNDTDPDYYSDTLKVDQTPTTTLFVPELGKAINATQHSDSKIYARSGATLGNGVLSITAAIPDEVVTIEHSGFSTDTDIFVNNLVALADTEYTGRGKVFPSRLLISPERFPETFDNPMADNAVYSNAIVDVNSDDGEEITGFSSFLAIASSSDSQVQSTLIVFKSKSVYAIDVVTRSQTKLESNGQGCTVPNSIAATSDGIMFANQSGIYVVTSSLGVKYLGKPMEGYWRDSVNKDHIEEQGYGFTDSSIRKYKLSVPPQGSNRNSEAVVYDYIAEEGEGGSWSLYDNIEASNWVQTADDTFFGNYKCRVFKIRTTGNATDYRDDDVGIESKFTYSPRYFGNSGEEVVLDSFVTHIQEGKTVNVEAAIDMSRDYVQLDTINNDETKRSFAVKNTPENARLLYIQPRYTHNTKDENFKLTGIDFRVAPTNAENIPDAAE